MADVSSWLRRLRRAMRVCLVSGLLLLLWSVIEGAATLFPMLFAGPALLVVAAAFLWWHWIRPRRLKRQRGPADLRLRRLAPGSLGPLAVAIVVTSIACEAIYLLHLRFLPVPAEDPFADFVGLAREPYGWVSLLLIAVVLAPLIEETVFRGWIQRPLERLWGPAPAIVITATLFSAIHLIPEYLLYYFLMGVLLGMAVVLTRSLWASVALHAAFNFQSMVLTYLGFGDFQTEIAVAQQTPVVLLSVVILVTAGIFLVSYARRLRALALARTRIVPVSLSP